MFLLSRHYACCNQALQLMWGEMRRQNELENEALTNDRYAEVSEINRVKSGYMQSIQNLQRAVKIFSAAPAAGGGGGSAPFPPDSGSGGGGGGNGSGTAGHDIATGTKGRPFVEGKLQGLMAQAENLLRRCTTHGATSTAVASPRPASSSSSAASSLPGVPKRGARLPGPPKRRPQPHQREANQGGAATGGDDSGGGGGDGSAAAVETGKKPAINMTGFGSSVQALVDDDTSFCSCVVS